MTDRKHDEVESSFIGITGCSAAVAKFYLDMAQGDVAAAVDQFYTSGGALAHPDSALQKQNEQDSVQNHEQSSVLPGPSRGREPVKQQSQRKPGRFLGFQDLKGSPEDSDDDEDNEYYTGGEKSGMVVKGGNGSEGKDVDTYFDMLETAGAQRGRPEDLQPMQSRSVAFTGRSRKVQDSGDAPTASSQSSGEAPRAHTITFWKNNVFTVNEGEPREMTDPANRQFLEAISRGEAPRELMNGDSRTEIRVNCIRSNSDYAAAPKKVAFMGRSQTLAGPAAETKVAQSNPLPSSSRTWDGVDPSQPTTSLQLRLADGARMVARFNQNHTLGDVRRFISISRPDLAGSYVLMTAFPPAELTDESKSLKEAGLLNAVVIQKTA